MSWLQWEIGSTGSCFAGSAWVDHCITRLVSVKRFNDWPLYPYLIVDSAYLIKWCWQNTWQCVKFKRYQFYNSIVIVLHKLIKNACVVKKNWECWPPRCIVCAQTNMQLNFVPCTPLLFEFLFQGGRGLWDNDTESSYV